MKACNYYRSIFHRLERQILMKSEKEQKAVRWAFLSDTHIPEDVNNNYRGFYPYRNLQKVVPGIVSTMPDGVAITGDLARLSGK